ncbi:BA14K family protein [uncultured Cohaesibacter sp.]|uniref:BA14K family protein n=1 Tax=uncultured Cohaesibacter sp. TaxID=1002546 RepID=UPI0029C7EACD|nr:BA14K family protein [uncultured Cohaesibacter sp.]
MLKKAIITAATIATMIATTTFIVPTTSANAKDVTAADVVKGVVAGIVVATSDDPKQPPKAKQAKPTPNKPMAAKPAPKKFSPEWKKKCQTKFKSFDPKTGYYKDKNGKKQMCK